MRTLHENDFDIDNYDEFYEHHYFQPLDDQHAIDAHRYLPRVSWALATAKKVKPKNILDLGCLEGFTALTLAKHYNSVETITGVDLSKDGIELAESRKHLVNAKANFIQDSVEHFLENTKDKYDFICLFELIEHVKDPGYLLKLIDKVKTKEGSVLISTPSFESPYFGMDDEQNKCHIRLYTVKDDYEAVNKYGTLRKATSITREIGKDRIVEIGVYSELINVRYI